MSIIIIMIELIIVVCLLCMFILNCIHCSLSVYNFSSPIDRRAHNYNFFNSKLALSLVSTLYLDIIWFRKLSLQSLTQVQWSLRTKPGLRAALGCKIEWTKAKVGSLITGKVINWLEAMVSKFFYWLSLLKIACFSYSKIHCEFYVNCEFY